MAIGSDGLGLIHFGGTQRGRRAGAHDRHVALVFILFEGGLAAGWGEIRPVLRTSVMLAIFGTARTGGDRGPGGRLAAGPEHRGGAAAGLDRVRHRQRRDLLGAARIEPQTRLARMLEGESGFNDPVAIVLVLGLHRVHPGPRLQRGATCSACRSSSSGSARAIGLVVGRLAVLAFQSAAVHHPRPVSRWPRSPPPRWASAWPTWLHALRLHRRLPDRPDARAAARSPASARSTTSTTAWRGSARSRCSSPWACW